MTTDPRSALLDAFREILDASFASTPEQLFINVPVAKLVDKALEMMASMPVVPPFDPEITPKQQFHSLLTRDEADAGYTFGKVWVVPTEDGGVVFCAEDGKTRQSTAVPLPTADAEQFLLAGFATVYQQRAASEG